MGFLTGLFKKKVGGTVVGNLLRGVVNTASKGLLGTGAGILTQEQSDKETMTDAAFLAKYGYNKQGVAPPSATPPLNPANSGGGYIPPYAEDPKTEKATPFMGLIIAVAAIFGIFYIAMKRR